MDKSKDIETLLFKYLIGMLIGVERERLGSWLKESPRNQILFDRMRDDASFRARYNDYKQIDSDKAWRRFNRKYYGYRQLLPSWSRYAAIFLLSLLLAGGWYYFSRTAHKMHDIEAAEAILPGISKATLILPDSTTKVLTAPAPVVIEVDNSTSAVSQGGALVYSIDPTAKPQSEAQQNSTLLTEKSNEFRVVFEDGTSVHLNYSSSLRYPVRFDKIKRVVHLEGEAYFKVAKDDRPFYVITENGTVKQYGTEFNVNTFTPGSTEVVLVEGSISVIADDSDNEQVLKPGQLAYVKSGEDNISVHDVDITPYVAWNEGRLIFENRSLESIVEILERWYNVKISFGSPELKQLHFTGNVDRYGTIGPILKAIARAKDLHIEVEGRNILIIEN